MDTCSVTHFRNHALTILDDLSRSGRELVVTRRGKALVRVEPVRGRRKVVLGRLQGAMKLNADITDPLGPDDWEAAR